LSTKLGDATADELFEFESEETTATQELLQEGLPWKILVVDDEPVVLKLTSTALQEFTFNDRNALLFEAGTIKTAKALLAQHNDFAVALLDVVMEDADSGLKLVNYIRNELGNSKIRILLRTGQAGMFSEVDVMEKFDINGYLSKHDLTVSKLRLNLMASLRAWEHLVKIDVLQDQVRQMARSAALGEFAAGVFHDLNTPLNIVSLSAEMALEVLASGAVDRVKKHLDKIQVASGRMKEFATALLNHSKQTKEDPTTFSLSEFGSELQNLCENRLSKNLVSLDHDGLEEKYKLKMPRTEIVRIVMNLINNACDALGQSEVRRVKLTFELQSEHFHLRVSDSGAGVPIALHEKIFDSFFTTKSSENGTGLGLSVARGLIQNMGGDLHLLPVGELGGATFQITLPRTCLEFS
jgi:C4-dicarboxylate-specific signal transduction histidine kinase